MEKQENQELVNKKNISTQYGVFAGISMAIVLLLFQLSGDDFNPFLKTVSVIPLAIFIAMTFNAIKKDGRSVFPSGVATGLKLSMIAAVTLIIFNIILFLINRDISFSKYSILPETGENLIMISAILLFEVFVFGGVVSFILMQSMKKSSKSA